MSWKRHIAYLAISIAGGFVSGFIVAILCTPLLWRLEPVLGIELAGHSGPADWVMEVFFVTFIVLIEVLLLVAHRRKCATKP
jgi:uncharacterized membrane protein YtjA (UPF0391 family)